MIVIVIQINKNAKHIHTFNFFYRAIVMSIAKCSRNVPFVLERLCDVDEAVRRAAFLYIAAINVTQLRVRQRLLTLKVITTYSYH